MTNNKIKIRTIEQIEPDQLIWDIENSKDFYIYELNNENNNVEILVKIIENDKEGLNF